ncbi:MAG: cellulose biosynthesis cyclic di-GMP-binding regulatory protein BcsB [Anaerolineales bacterium]|nr:cellulose biosynthesis cyclic di-GMP-binding regulatory protein BcsB [Anaerolineales bacterium]MDW8448324.1 cellulose biosynthesis cyclic di-GMP-binding regulatory protein BcsB [Anaerolineales bacterium]
MKLRKIFILFLGIAWLSSLPVEAFAARAQALDEVLWLPLQQFGYPATIRISGQIGERYLYLPIPAGMQPEELKFTLRHSADVESGFLELYNRERVLHTIALGSAPQRVELSLSDAQVEGNLLVLRLVSRLRSQDNICETAYVGAWLDLEEAEIQLSGIPSTPQTVGEFFPPLLSDLVIEVPVNPSPAQAEAALRLIAALTLKYANRPFQFHLVSERDEIPVEVRESPLARRVVLRTHPQGAIRLQSDSGLPTLILQGEGDAFTAQGAWLTSELTPLGVHRQIQVLEWKDPIEANRHTVTLAELGYPLQQVSGVGRIDIAFAFSQADLGGPVRNLRARLVGTHTPVEALASATLTVLFNGAQVYSRLLSTDTQFDLYLDFPNPLLRRENTLTLRFDYTPRQGECRIGISPFTAQLWENSYLQFDSGDVLPAGFLRFPQGLLPEFEVTIAPLTPQNLRRAAELIIALQKASKKPLRLKWSDWQTALSSPQIWFVIQSDPALVTALKPPLELVPFRIVDFSGRELLRFEGQIPFAALQAFEHNRRQVLLLSASGDAALMDRLLLSLKQSPNSWYDLAGDVYLIGEGMAQGVGMNVRGGAVRVEPLQPSTAVWFYRLRPYLLGLSLLGMLALLVWLYPRVVRKQPSGL